MFKILTPQVGLIMFSRILERFGYYVIRSIIVTTAISKLGVPTKEIIDWYIAFVITYSISQAIAGILGDILKNRKVLNITGSFFQILGICLLIPENEITYFLGAFIFTIGSGFYSNTVIASFGSLYPKSRQIQNHAWMLFFLVVTLGSTLGIITGVYLSNQGSEVINYTLFGAIILFILSGIVNFKSLPNHFEIATIKGKKSGNKSVLVISMIAIANLLFWTSIELLGDVTNTFTQGVEGSFEKELIINTCTTIIVGLSIIGFGLFAKIHSTRFFSVAFIFLGIGTLIYHLPLNSPKSPWTALLLIRIVISIGEVILLPLMHSIMTRFTNPRFLGSVFGVSAMIMGINSWGILPNVAPYFNELMYQQQFNTIAIAAFGIAILLFSSSLLFKDASPYFVVNEEDENRLKEGEILD